MASPVYKKQIHLKADNEQETADVGLQSFVDISRDSIQILKVNKAFKAIELFSYSFPYSSNNGVWTAQTKELIESGEFQDAIGDSNKHFSVSDNSVTLIPSSLYSESTMKENFEFVFGRTEELNLRQYQFKNSEIVGIHALPTELLNVIGEDHSSSFLIWVDELIGNSQRTSAHLILEATQFALVIFRDSKLAFSNWFSYGKPDDVLYFLMATLESLNILHSDIRLVLGGTVNKGDETFQTISRFISKISFQKAPKNLTYSYSFSQLSEHRFPYLFATACA